MIDTPEGSFKRMDDIACRTNFCSGHSRHLPRMMTPMAPALARE
jgi:hypothetical protein